MHEEFSEHAPLRFAARPHGGGHVRYPLQGHGLHGQLLWASEKVLSERVAELFGLR